MPGRFAMLLAVVLAASAQAAAHPVVGVGDEASLRQTDEQQRTLIAARDAAGMAALTDPTCASTRRPTRC